MRTIKVISMGGEEVSKEVIEELAEITGWEKMKNGVYNNWYQSKWAFHYEGEEREVINLSKKYSAFKFVLEEESNKNFTVIYYRGQIIDLSDKKNNILGFFLGEERHEKNRQTGS